MADPTVILVHGAWHASWCWKWMTPLLDREGMRYVAVDLPFTGHEQDVASVVQVLDDIDGPKVVVAHSYGGLVVSGAAAGRSDVAHLLYVTAFLCRSDRPFFKEFEGVDDAVPVLAAARMEDGALVIDPADAPHLFYGECPPDVVAEACSRLRPFGTTDGTRALGEPWRSVPSTYVLCSRDNTIRPEAQRLMAQHASKVVELDTDHSPFASRPEELFAVLQDVHGSG